MFIFLAQAPTSGTRAGDLSASHRAPERDFIRGGTLRKGKASWILFRSTTGPSGLRSSYEKSASRKSSSLRSADTDAICFDEPTGAFCTVSSLSIPLSNLVSGRDRTLATYENRISCTASVLVIARPSAIDGKRKSGSSAHSRQVPRSFRLSESARRRVCHKVRSTALQLVGRRLKWRCGRCAGSWWPLVAATRHSMPRGQAGACFRSPSLRRIQSAV